MAEKIYSVSEITGEIRSLLEGGLGSVWVEGEISNLREPGSGHRYFTLKDATAQLSCVLFRGSARYLAVELANGLKVRIQGDLSVYEARGQYQIIARKVEPKGHGELQAKFEALKRKLEDEGLFDPERKRAIPVFPRTIGIVTSPGGAAIRDMLQVLGRRAPWIRVIVEPVRVQGEGAAEEIAAGVAAFGEAEDRPAVDLVIVARGGGSIEDLWAFNEEVVARAIAACPVPVMSGVGHEIDFTIADFVADRREPTPSAAAENATPDGGVLHRQLEQRREGLESVLGQGMRRAAERTEALRRELDAREPARLVRNWMQTVDFLGERMRGLAESGWRHQRGQLDQAARALSGIRPERFLAEKAVDAQRWLDRLDHAADRSLEAEKLRGRRAGELLDSLSPEAVLRRGFSVTTGSDGRILTREEQVAAGEVISTRLAEGTVKSRVEE